MNKDVTTYISKQKSPNMEICKKLRNLVLKYCPTKSEGMKFGVPWYERFYIVSLKDHVNFGVCIDGLSKKDLQILEGSGKSMRHIKFYDLKDIDEKAIMKLIKASCL